MDTNRPVSLGQVNSIIQRNPSEADNVLEIPIDDYSAENACKPESKTISYAVVWMLLATQICRNVGQRWRLALEQIATHDVANLTGRIEPRMIKRGRDYCPLMHDPRRQLRAELTKT